MTTKQVKLSQVKVNKDNPRTITKDKFQKLINSLLVFPNMLELRPVVVDARMVALGGNMRLNALKEISKMPAADIERRLGDMPEYRALSENERKRLVERWACWLDKQLVPVIDACSLSESERRQFIIKDNVSFGAWDYDELATNWDNTQLEQWGMDVWNWEDGGGASGPQPGQPGDVAASHVTDSLGKDEVDDGQPQVDEQKRGAIERRFLIPPFSVLNSNSGRWQQRKKYWLSLGIKSELGREGNLVFALSAQPPGAYKKKAEIEAKIGRTLKWDEFAQMCPDAIRMTGTSIFDPVVCELAYRWFMPSGNGLVIDPFCGGSVRGIVAAAVGKRYWGNDLRQEQVDANIANAREVCNGIMPSFSCGDSCDIKALYGSGEDADLIFSCPPYADLERYSDDSRDLSTMRYPDFLKSYNAVIAQSCALLKDGRFAVWVVGEVRGKDGEYYNFVGDTIAAFKAAGLKYYNCFVLYGNTSSLAMRVTRTFRTRKCGPCHQYILVFYKGDLANIKDEFEPVDLSYLIEEGEDNERSVTDANE